MATPHRNAALSIAEALQFIAPGVRTPDWPPDVFAVAAFLLQKSNAYAEAVHAWPPSAGAGPAPHGPQVWAGMITRVGGEWRVRAIGSQAAPAEVQAWWTQLQTAATAGALIQDICTDIPLCHALLQLCAAADEASAGVGGPTGIAGSHDQDEYWTETAEMVQESGTLCRQIDRSRVRVLPKLHTPQTGVTLRSLTHNLALCTTGDIEPKWYLIPTGPEEARLNLLLIPWPMTVRPRQFRELEGPIANLPAQFGFFTFDSVAASPSAPELAARVRSLHARASEIAGRIDGVVFPELALSADEYRVVQAELEQLNCMVIAGISVPPRAQQTGVPAAFGENYVAINLPTQSASSASRSIGIAPQHKHHRWRLDRSQILQYGLAGSLDPNRTWWEYIALRDRCLSFLAINPWLTLCVLICEDLARQDPVAELVRAVGPNLVIALLMDGPQLRSRWPGRSAMVLADDPGSSVLTLTNWGLTQICRPPSVKECSRAIALWKDARTGGPVEIELEPDAEALVLSFAIDRVEEWTADGRSDRGATGYPILGGVHQVRRA